ncbi:pentapeptide repeat-containing protein [Bradyrhizobium sp.]
MSTLPVAADAQPPPMGGGEKPKLRLANGNPWYCLATLYGEQPEALSKAQWDKELAAKNRTAWNRWMAGGLGEDERAALMKTGFPEPELVPLTPEEKSSLCTFFASRLGRDNVLPPDPSEVVDFADTHFDRIFIFIGFLCTSEANFNSATFSGEAGFRSAVFSGYANFESATFSGEAGFISATFSVAANFKSVTFSDDAYFISATFSGNAVFKSATFSGYAYFLSATFSGYIYFDSATFSGYTYFDSATFSGYTHFISATFSHEAGFKSATFSSNAYFNSATFSGEAGFMNAAFAANTVFAKAHFTGGVPDFRGAKMHEATEWHGVHWPSAPQDRTTAQAQVYAYERLKLEMERLRKHEDEYRFFRMELRARRELALPLSPEWFLNYLYEATSDYGLSIGRPLYWLAGLFVIGASVFYTTHTGVAALSLEAIPHAAALSFANIIPFVPITHDITTKVAVGLSRTEKIVGVVQTLLGAPLLFLLGLALRNRFRMT